MIDTELKQLYSNIHVLDDDNIQKLREIKNTLSLQDQTIQMIENFKALISPIDNQEFLAKFWSPMPNTSKKSTANDIQTFLASVNQLVNYKATNSSSRLQSIVTELENSYYSCYHFLTELNSQYERQKISSKLASLPENYAKKAKKDIEYIEKVKDDAQSFAGETGTAANWQIFEKQSDYYRDSSRLWGWLTILSIFAIAGLAYYLLQELTNKPAHIEIIIYIARFLILSALLIIPRTLIKNFNASMHLMTLNKHRANCMKTYKLIIDASSDEQTRNTMTTQAAETIFKAGDTGFLHKNSKNTELSSGQITVNLTDHIK